MLNRILGFSIGLLSWMSTASAQVLTLPDQTTGLSPLTGELTGVDAVRFPVADAVTGVETRLTFKFMLQGCLDSLLPLISHYDVQDQQVTVYITALNAHNQQSIAATCIAPPQATAQLSIPGIFQRDQIRVVFLEETPAES